MKQDQKTSKMQTKNTQLKNSTNGLRRNCTGVAQDSTGVAQELRNTQNTHITTKNNENTASQTRISPRQKLQRTCMMWCAYAAGEDKTGVSTRRPTCKMFRQRPKTPPNAALASGELSIRNHELVPQIMKQSLAPQNRQSHCHLPLKHHM